MDSNQENESILIKEQGKVQKVGMNAFTIQGKEAWKI
jgi:hypothetical protein